LAEARVHADLIIDTATVNIREMTAHVLSFLRERAGSG
jgi:hypothetical protein